MARTLTPLLLCCLLVGCASTGSTQGIPAPSFNAPVVAGPSTPVVAARSMPAPVPPPMVRPGLAYERGWVPSASPRPWRYIIIHHSATPSGSAAKIDIAHRARGFDELGYHFVIGNGTDSGNGQVEIGPRWPKQKHGAHDNAGDNRYNEYGIGICLVGDFEIERPTPQQLQSLTRLVAYLMRTYNIPASRVLGHGQTKETQCPGKNLNVASVIRSAERILADAGDAIPEDQARPAAGTELLTGVDQK